MKVTIMRSITFFAVCLLLLKTPTTHAEVITNADIVVGSLIFTLPASWGSGEGESVLFDGVTVNPGTGRYFSFQNSGTVLSPTNFVRIVGDLINPFDVTDIRIANDFGSDTTQEITILRTILSNASGVIFDQTFNNIEDNVINDIDDLATGLNVTGMTHFEIQFIGQDIFPAFEVREFIFEGSQATIIPESSTYISFFCTIIGASFFLHRRRKKLLTLRST